MLCALIAAGSLLLGCAAKPQAAKPANAPVESAPVESAQGNCQGASVAALVFDPPILQNQPPLELSRESRQAGAFVGYEQLTTTFFYLRTDDRFRTDGTDRFERRAISERVGMSFR
jgi:hypothetical protein